MDNIVVQLDHMTQVVGEMQVNLPQEYFAPNNKRPQNED